MAHGGKRRTWTDEELTNAVRSSDSMAETVRKLGLSATTNKAVRGRIAALGLDTSHFPVLRPTDRAKAFTEARLREVVSGCNSYSQVLRQFGYRPVGSMIAHVQRRVLRYGICTAHFRVTTAGRPGHNRLTSEQVLVLMPEGSHRQKTETLRRAMIEAGIPHVCGECGNPGKWNGKSLTLDIDHINGEWRDNRRSNLRFLCPNCHSQTETWRAMNQRRRRKARALQAQLDEQPGEIRQVFGSTPEEGTARKTTR